MNIKEISQMHHNKNGLIIALCVFFFILISALTILLARNIIIKKKVSDFQSALYIWKAEELAKISREAHKEAVVVLNDNEGLWDKEGATSIEVVHDLTIGENSEDERYLFYGGGDVIADDDGNIYVLLRMEGLIRKYNQNGKYLLTIGREGQGPGDLMQPTRCLIDDQDILHVIEYGNKRISRFNLQGRYLDSVPIQFQAIPRQFGIDKDGNYYISFYDRETETTIHKFDSQGRLIKSFGEPIYLTRAVHFAERGTIIENCNQGHIFIDNNFIYFSRRNPYDIRKYTLDGKLKLLIFRKNSFMPPKKMKIVGKQRYQFSAPVQPKFIAVRQGKLINLISVPTRPQDLFKKLGIGWVIDIFDLNGNLLTSYKSKIQFYPNFIDKNNRIYGFSGDLTKVYRFSMRIKHSKNNGRK